MNMTEMELLYEWSKNAPIADDLRHSISNFRYKSMMKVVEDHILPVHEEDPCEVSVCDSTPLVEQMIARSTASKVLERSGSPIAKLAVTPMYKELGLLCDSGEIQLGFPGYLPGCPVDVFIFTTGSFAFGVDTAQSDIDLVVSPVREIDYVPLYMFLADHSKRNHNAPELSQSHSAKLDLAGGTVDVIVKKSPSQFLAWFYATKAMQSLPKEKLMDKIKRVAAFEKLVSAFIEIV